MKTLLSLLLFIGGFFSVLAQPPAVFRPEDQPSPPDYTREENWSALPFRADMADILPYGETWISDSLKPVDVFYIYPTLYLKGTTWNADLGNKQLNDRIDKYPVQYHASVFNAVGRVYAPRYRQAILKSFSDTTGNGERALAFAYDDVRRAFVYYLEHYNQGRPIIIASHSQGSHHARRLLKEFFDEPQLQKRLVCAYVIGFAVHRNQYTLLQPCADSTATGCYITWASFHQGYRPPADSPLLGDVCINPLTWTSDTLPAEGRGAILLNIRRKKPYRTQAFIHDRYLWVKTSTPFMQAMGNMHIADYNLFWMDMRRNVSLRVNHYLRKTGNTK